MRVNPSNHMANQIGEKRPQYCEQWEKGRKSASQWRFDRF
jgi:hypothetical protein